MRPRIPRAAPPASRRLLLAGALALAVPRLGRGAPGPSEPVDVLLLLAADVSRSMDEEESRLQRRGYADALRDPRVQAAMTDGPHGAVAIAYLEWSGPEHQVLVLPWTRIASPAEAEAPAARLLAAPPTIGTWTSIAAALDRGRALIEAAPFAAGRRVIDVSGDGSNNAGGAVEEARDRAVGAGIVVNGLPVMRDGPAGPRIEGMSLPLDHYYREQVTGGQGSFVLPAEDFRAFGDAVRRKLILEIAEGGGAAGDAA